MTPEDLQAVVEQVTDAILPSAQGPGLIFVWRKIDAMLLAEALQCPFVTGDVPVKDREEIASQMKAGAVGVVVATDAWSTGIDIPCVSWVALEAWTKAPIGIMQRVGRASRIADAKPGFQVHVLPGKFEAEIREVLIASGQAVALDVPGTPKELADFLLLGRQPKGRQLKHGPEPKPPRSYAFEWGVAIILLLGLICHWCQTGRPW